MNRKSETSLNEFEQLLASAVPVPPVASPEIVFYQAGFEAGLAQHRIEVSDSYSTHQRFSYGLIAGIAATLFTMFALQRPDFDSLRTKQTSTSIEHTVVQDRVDVTPSTGNSQPQGIVKVEPINTTPMYLPVSTQFLISGVQSMLSKNNDHVRCARPLTPLDLQTYQTGVLIGAFNRTDADSAVSVSPDRSSSKTLSQEDTSAQIPQVNSLPLREQLLREQLY